jgi:hypothetical protein
MKPSLAASPVLLHGPPWDAAAIVSDVKSSAEFVVLSTSHARKQVDLAVTHLAALRGLSLVANETS